LDVEEQVGDTAIPTSAERRVWDTHDVPAREALDYYRDAVCSAFSAVVPVVAPEVRARFDGRIEATITGEGYLNRVRSTTHRVSRSPREIARGDVDWHYLFYDPHGRCAILQNGTEVVTRRSDLVLFSGIHPFTLTHAREPRLSILTFMMPGRFLRQRLGGDGPAEPVVVSEHQAFGSMIRDAARLLTDDDPTQLSPDGRAVMFDTMFELIGLTLMSKPPQEPAARSRSHALFQLVSNEVQRKFRNPRLGAAQLAASYGISPRYVHKLFEQHGSGRTLSDLLNERRLSWAAERMRAPEGRDDKISDIAFAAGFSDLSQFYRAFRRRYGLPPGRFQTNAAAAAAPDI
jgi:AraC family transcriptional regulator, positive regulator of tynA and feaB